MPRTPTRIAITGAGGWLGLELLELLRESWGSEALVKNVIALGSADRRIELSDGTKVTIHKMGNEVRFEDLDGFVHLAFQTKGKLSQLGQEKFISTNLSITSDALKIIESSRPRWVSTVSSGAAYADYGAEQLEFDIERNPYGFLKNIEESLLTSMCNKLSIRLCIGRLWGAGGRFMPINREYALSDFIFEALTLGRITVKSTAPVYRRYVNASAFMEAVLGTAVLATNAVETFNSGGEMVEIGELAEIVGEVIGVPVLRAKAFDGALPDHYTANPDKFTSICENLQIKHFGIRQIVADTVFGHKVQLNLGLPSSTLEFERE